MSENKVTPQNIEDSICAVQYHHFEGTTLIVAAVTLKNGFTVTGQAACADPGIFDEEFGQHLALEDAKQKIWPLLAFRLRDDITEGRITLPNPEEDVEDESFQGFVIIYLTDEEK